MKKHFLLSINAVISIMLLAVTGPAAGYVPLGTPVNLKSGEVVYYDVLPNQQTAIGCSILSATDGLFSFVPGNKVTLDSYSGMDPKNLTTVTKNQMKYINLTVTAGESGSLYIGFQNSSYDTKGVMTVLCVI